MIDIEPLETNVIDEDDIQGQSLIEAVEAVESVEDIDVNVTDIIDEDDIEDEPVKEDEPATALDNDADVMEQDNTIDYIMPSLFSKRNADRNYIVRSFTNSFLRTECNISLESSKTVCKFTYEGESYSGIVMKKVDSENYVFLVEYDYKNKKDNDKFLKIINIPKAILKYARPRL